MKYKITIYLDAELVDAIERRGVSKSLFIETAIQDALENLKDDSPVIEPVEEELVIKKKKKVSSEEDMIAAIIEDIGYTPQMFRIQGNRFNKGQEDAIALEMRKRYSRMIGTELIYKLLPEEFKT